MNGLKDSTIEFGYGDREKPGVTLPAKWLNGKELLIPYDV